MEDFYDWFKVVEGVILLLIALVYFIENILDTRRNNRDIENLKIQMKTLKDSVLNKK